MPTPNTYDAKNFRNVLKNATNLFHQTSIKNLPAIINSKKILSPGTLWGINPLTASSNYITNNTRLINLKNQADRGFIDYIFCSFFNGIQAGFHRYGYVSIEIDKNILLSKEAFIYPFNFKTSWNFATAADKYSDLTTWDISIQHHLQNRVNFTEVLIRKQIKLSPNWVKFHCFRSHSQFVIDLLSQTGYNYDVVEHENPTSLERFKMNELERYVQIGTSQYKGLLSSDGRYISIFNDISDDDMDLLGRFEVDETGNLIEVFPVTGRKEIVGKLLQTDKVKQAL